uniref:DNA-directed RNA polymerase n=1 Tax=Chlamydomonas leiostraca TaxID=1034604 RepID=A0A1L2M581_9CHLO|nr:RNA polymerase beta subunit 1 [Chlamydomonas leiostraca]APD80617.1 RNA polymerase beta subunit 1 [Chlamydomonas leiostraca]
MPINRYFLSDFVSIQRQSFFELLERGLIEEFQKRNPITNTKKDLSLLFYPEYYVLTRPEYTPQEAIFKNKSYTSKLYVPAQLTDKNLQIVSLKWVYIGNIPLMTKRGHFILNGAARVIVNQILRSPGIYYQQKIYENTNEKSTKRKPEDSYKRFYADLICMRGTWLRIEMDKEKNIWAQMKKGPKIPIYWFLLAMGLSEKIIFKSILDSYKLIGNLETTEMKPKNAGQSRSPNESQQGDDAMPGPEGPPVATSLVGGNDTNLGGPDGPKGNRLPVGARSTKSKHKNKNKTATSGAPRRGADEGRTPKGTAVTKGSQKYAYLKNPPEAWEAIYALLASRQKRGDTKEKNLSLLGRKWLYNRFMNPRTYDLGKQGRLAFNRKLGLNMSEATQTTLTGLDVLYATDYLIKVEKGIYKTDDIDHLKNRRVRTSGELIQIQVGVGLVRLEKSIRDAFTKVPTIGNAGAFGASRPADGLRSKGGFGSAAMGSFGNQSSLTRLNSTKILSSSSATLIDSGTPQQKNLKPLETVFQIEGHTAQTKARSGARQTTSIFYTKSNTAATSSPSLSAQSFINNKAFNSAMREFFGTSPLSQFMDQINPLAELTHKRRLSSMGPGGVTRDTATLAIRGIHPTHYGRICPIETPEGKNTGLVNSMTTYARVNPNGIIESPFYKVYKGQVQKNAGMYYFSAEQEEKIKLAAADLSVSSINFLPKSLIPVRIAEDFTKIARSKVEYIGVSPLQMISIAASLIPFLEHDDANRALMGSNMQRQAVPLIRPERPIVGTGLEARAVSDSGHALQAKYSGVVTYVSANKIIVYSLA